MTEGFKFIAEIPDGANWIWHPRKDGSVIVVHKDHQVAVLTNDGKWETIIVDDAGNVPADAWVTSLPPLV